MAGKNMETAFHLLRGVQKDFFRNLLWHSNGRKKILTSNNDKISTNSDLLHQLQLYPKRHLEMHSMKQKKIVLIIKNAKQKKTASYQRATQTVTQILLKYQTATQISNNYWSRQEKNQRTPCRACLSSSHPLRS